MTLDTLTVATLNCQGTIKAHKINRIFAQVNHLHLVALQETGLTKDNSVIFYEIFGKQFYIFSSFATNQNSKTGVTLLLNKNITFQNTHLTFEIKGRAIAVNFEILNNKFFALVIYAPALRKDRPEFFKDVLHMVATAQLNVAYRLLLGDFNCVEFPALDRSVQRDTSESGVKVLQEITQTLQLQDSYRHKQKTEKVFTFLSKIHMSQSRIDRIYGSMNLADNAIHFKIIPNTYSDHSIFVVTFSTRCLTQERGKGYWKLNTTVLQNNATVAKTEHILLELQQNIQQANNKQCLILWDSFKKNISSVYKTEGIMLARHKTRQYNKLSKQLNAAKQRLTTQK